MRKLTTDEKKQVEDLVKKLGGDNFVFLAIEDNKEGLNGGVAVCSSLGLKGLIRTAVTFESMKEEFFSDCPRHLVDSMRQLFDEATKKENHVATTTGETTEEKEKSYLSKLAKTVDEIINKSK